MKTSFISLVKQLMVKIKTTMDTATFYTVLIWLPYKDFLTLTKTKTGNMIKQIDLWR